MASNTQDKVGELHFKLAAQTDQSFEGKQSLKVSGTNNYFKNAEWSPDGTCVITNSADNHVRTFVIPPNLLEDREQPLDLTSFSTIASLEPVNAVACYPHYDLQDVATTLILSTASEHPIRLHSALTGNLVSSYSLVSPTTEAYIRPHSLLFSPDGTHFIAGSGSLISYFTLARCGQGPISSIKTGPKSSKASWSNPATSLRGLVSALDIDRPYNVLAAGTLSRQIGLYDAGGQGECIGVFSLSGTEADLSIGGGGVTQVLWSQCGRYLYVSERKSNGAVIYDIRNTGQLLSWLVGRNAMTNQRMKVELANLQGRDCVWAGGIDGKVRYWDEAHLKEGEIEPSFEQDVHADVTNSISMHHNANILATAAGQRQYWDNVSQRDSSLKLWQII